MPVTQPLRSCHYNDVIMSAMASQITSLTIVYSTVYSGADQRKYQSSASLAFVWGIHLWPVNSPRKRPVTQKMFQFDDVIMLKSITWMPGSKPSINLWDVLSLFKLSLPGSTRQRHCIWQYQKHFLMLKYVIFSDNFRWFFCCAFLLITR